MQDILLLFQKTSFLDMKYKKDVMTMLASIINHTTTQTQSAYLTHTLFTPSTRTLKLLLHQDSSYAKFSPENATIWQGFHMIVFWFLLIPATNLTMKMDWDCLLARLTTANWVTAGWCLLWHRLLFTEQVNNKRFDVNQSGPCWNPHLGDPLNTEGRQCRLNLAIAI